MFVINVLRSTDLSRLLSLVSWLCRTGFFFRKKQGAYNRNKGIFWVYLGGCWIFVRLVFTSLLCVSFRLILVSFACLIPPPPPPPLSARLVSLHPSSPFQLYSHPFPTAHGNPASGNCVSALCWKGGKSTPCRKRQIGGVEAVWFVWCDVVRGVGLVGFG